MVKVVVVVVAVVVVMVVVVKVEIVVVVGIIGARHSAKCLTIIILFDLNNNPER